MDTVKGKTIWIIGASSGIGEALARHLDHLGANLILSARGEDKLNTVKNTLNGEHLVVPLDVSDIQSLQDTTKKISEEKNKIDSAIALAAIYDPGLIADMDMQAASKIVDVNLKGIMNVTSVIMPILKEQGTGQLVLCGSVAGYVGLPNAQPYSATKAAVMNFAQSLYIETKDSGVDVKLISPGFVETPMTDKNDFDMPMIIKPEQAAEAIAKGLLQKGFEIHFPKKFTFLMKVLRLLPHPLYFSLAKRMVKK